MPDFFSQRRIRAMRDVFHEIDVDDGLNLDQEELAPFYEYVFYKLFDVNLTKAEQQQVRLKSTDADDPIPPLLWTLRFPTLTPITITRSL